MNKQMVKYMTDLQRLLARQEFHSQEELQAFLQQLTGQEIPSLPTRELTIQEQAQDLVFAAYSLPPGKAWENAIKALQLDPDCIEAYELLGQLEPVPQTAIAFYERGIAIGRQIFGGRFLKENKGYFWGIHETRPFMRCLFDYSECLYNMDKVKECVAVMEEMIELNPSDNQGVRDLLLLYLIQLDERKKFERYAKQYDDDGMAYALFNRALFAFKTEGECEYANQKLKEAIKENKYVAAKLLAKKRVRELPAAYGFGSVEEANYYAAYAQPIWQQTEGALEWLRKFSKKR